MFHNHFLKLIIIFLCLFSTQIHADATENRRVMISASVFPKIIAVDEDLSAKLDSSGQVRLGLIYKNNKTTAEKIKKQMLRKIKNIANKNIVIDIINTSEFSMKLKDKLSGIFIVDHIANFDINTIKNYSNQNNIIFFSPYEGDVERGVMAGIFIGSKIRPYFNMKSLTLAKVKLKPAILKVSKIYE